jgi:hypothetical protein
LPPKFALGGISVVVETLEPAVPVTIGPASLEIPEVDVEFEDSGINGCGGIIKYGVVVVKVGSAQMAGYITFPPH